MPALRSKSTHPLHMYSTERTAYPLGQLLEQETQVLANLVRVDLAEMMAQLVAPRELLLADGAAEGSLHHVLHRLQLAAALARVHHHLHL